MIFEVLSLTLLLGITLGLCRASYPRGFPPGPAWKLPIIGHILTISRPNILSGFENVRRRYGNICGFYYGQRPSVLVSDVGLIKKIGSDAGLNQRRFIYGLADIQGYVTDGAQRHMAGILVSSKENWREQRNFTMAGLRALGMGKQKMQTKIIEETKKLCDELRGYKGKPVDVESTCRLAVGNSLWVHVTGKDIGPDDSKLDNNHEMTKILFNPWSSMLLTSKHLYTLTKKLLCPSFFDSIAQRANFVKTVVKEHEQTFNKDCVRDLTDIYIKRWRNETDPSSSFYGQNGKSNMEVALTNVMSGSDTINIALSWCILYMVLYPDVQAKVQKELDSMDKELLYPQDHKKTPYTCATIQEVLRMATIIPQGIRIASEDTTVGPFFIPKGCRIMLNYLRASRDPSNYDNPTAFKPERYISQEGKFVPLPADLPFSYGKRRCIGESFSKMALYLFFTKLARNFDICKAHPGDCLSTEPVLAVVTPPKPFKVRFVERKQE